jgi:two-component system, chemotaxis family, chemotaxis protein CheY
MKSLVVEENRKSALQLQKVLGKFGEVSIAGCAEEALQQIQLSIRSNSNYDLICLDNYMSGIDGQCVLEEIRRLEQEEGIPVERRTTIFMCPGTAQKKCIVEAFRAGCDAYLFEPVDPAQLDALIEHSLIDSAQ